MNSFKDLIMPARAYSQHAYKAFSNYEKGRYNGCSRLCFLDLGIRKQSSTRLRSSIEFESNAPYVRGLPQTNKTLRDSFDMT